MTTRDIASFVAESALQEVKNVTLTWLRMSDQCSKAEAYRIYGRAITDRWVAEGLLTVINKRISRKQLQRIAARCNRQTYLPVAER